jgi:hypothetical protein
VTGKSSACRVVPASSTECNRRVISRTASKCRSDCQGRCTACNRANTQYSVNFSNASDVKRITSTRSLCQSTNVKCSTTLPSAVNENSAVRRNVNLRPRRAYIFKDSAITNGDGVLSKEDKTRDNIVSIDERYRRPIRSAGLIVSVAVLALLVKVTALIVYVPVTPLMVKLSLTAGVA